jgi:YrbI family 3-deoxy-D-manno-octulosonate 8-phosphate phosphatase
MDTDQRDKIQLILSDVDGVLTDGGIVFDNQGIETKRFNIRDGLGIKLWQKAGFRFGFLTARSSHIVKLRASELGVDLLRQGFEDKLPSAKKVIEELQLETDQICYIGDDLPDLPVMRFVGWSVAVADAVQEVRDAADYVTERRGGEGAVREAIEGILRSKGLWEDLIRRYTGK